MASEPTRGPAAVGEVDRWGGRMVFVKHDDTASLFATIAPVVGDKPGCNQQMANADLVAAAVISSTAARDLGFDPIGAIEALPELLKAAREYANCQRINPDVRCHECDRDIHAALQLAGVTP